MPVINYRTVGFIWCIALIFALFFQNAIPVIHSLDQQGNIMYKLYRDATLYDGKDHVKVRHSFLTAVINTHNRYRVFYFSMNLEQRDVPVLLTIRIKNF